MIVKHLSLQHFRSYTKADFTFSPQVTCIVGPNTAGKSNLLEATMLLATGQSPRADKDIQLLQHAETIGRVKGVMEGTDGETDLELIFSLPEATAERVLKKYLVNGISRRRLDFAGQIKAILFTPEDLDIIITSPSVRRRFLDDVLEQIDREYRLSLSLYTKAIRQRNALLEVVRESGIRSVRQFEYWDELLIRHGNVVTKKREELIQYINNEQKNVYPVHVVYDCSRISPERLLQYKDAEVGAGVTLVGPHRDDFRVSVEADQPNRNVRDYGSRGQQRLVVLQLKLLQLSYIEKQIGERPLLLLDDIFSELDSRHIGLVLDVMTKQQTIITTTHKEFVDSIGTMPLNMIELKK